MSTELFLLTFLQNTSAQWFDKETLFTAAGSTTVVITVTAILQRWWPNIPGRWVALGLSLVIALLAISARGESWTGLGAIIALMNGIMTYAAAIGINTVVTAPPPPPPPPSTGQGAQAAAPSYRWWA